jgi:argininosuccinate lyase
MRLWDKGTVLDPEILAFTAAEDAILDNELLPYDLRASAVHAEALQRAGVLTLDEMTTLHRQLGELEREWSEGRFRVSAEDEDCHTAIENALVRVLGDLGKKIHTGRSRNDQVLVALRLYQRDRIAEVEHQMQALENSVRGFADRHGGVSFPGYTHTRPAMPTTMASWAGALVDALQDDQKLLRAVIEITDQNPLGTGAGYGVPLPLDRQLTTERLGFRRLQTNPIYTQHSRPKFEALILHGLTQILLDLNRFASDIIFLSLEGLLVLPEELTTGSSIMPQKKNPDPLELVRARYHQVLAWQMEALTLPANLIMGYHRDYQMLKRPVMEAFRTTTSALSVMTLVFHRLSADAERCRVAITPEVLATERVYALIREGIPFRDAYRRVADEIKKS